MTEQYHRTSVAPGVPLSMMLDAVNSDLAQTDRGAWPAVTTSGFMRVVVLNRHVISGITVEDPSVVTSRPADQLASLVAQTHTPAVVAAFTAAALARRSP